jgi:septum site-determining protein MinD
VSKIIAIHSFRKGSGKSHAAANIAALLAIEGRRVGIIDTNIQSPALNYLFGLKEDLIKYSLNDYLLGRCDIKDVTYDITSSLKQNITGQILLIPSSNKSGALGQLLREGYNVHLLKEALDKISADNKLDVLLIETQAGLNEETLVLIAISRALAVVMYLDQADYQGTGVIVEVARKLSVPRITLIVNDVPTVFELSKVREEVEATYRCPVAAVLPHSDELMALASKGLFAMHFPNHPITQELKQAAKVLVS